MSQYQASQSPPPLRHPVPTHPAYIPEPPSTPASPQGYQRFSSSPGPGGPIPPLTQQQFPTHQPHQQPHLHPQAHQPDFTAWGIDGATAQLGMQLGSSAVAAGQEYVQKNLGTIFPSTYLKHHFNVSNSYVIHKLRLVLFPWTHKPWSRRVRRTEHGLSEWQPPRDDINSPDLYIPVMAIVTYVLLVALQSGLELRFRPQILGESASRALLVVFLDFAFVKLGCYILGIQGSSQVIDLVAYGGYKFVGVILTVTAGFLGLQGPLWILVFIYFFLANAFFLLRSLRSVVLPDPSISISTNPNATTSVSPPSAVCQIVYMAALVRI
ncbi:YIF1-domain-containing protein [Cyathus striatus]|nr:YIF1-domain-containing protein [Cyathus striatus]